MLEQYSFSPEHFRRYVNFPFKLQYFGYMPKVYHPVLRVLFLIVKNVCGIVLVLMGVAMLVLPGQGILAILIGLLFLDFPGKFAMERWLVERRPVIHAINWLRAKAHREPLDLPKS